MPSEKNTLRAAIYARYSSGNQRAASIEDQVEVYRRYAEARAGRSSRSTLTVR